MISSSSSRSTTVWLVAISDIIGLVIGFNLAFFLRFDAQVNWQSPLVYGLLLVYLFGLYLTDTYRLGTNDSAFWLPGKALIGILSTVLGMTSLIYLTGSWGSSPLFGRGILAISAGFFTIWAITCRTFAQKWLGSTRDRVRFLILGDGEKTAHFEKEYRDKPGREEFVLLKERNKALAGRLHHSVIASGNCLEADSAESDSKSVFQTDDLDNFEYWSSQPWSGILIADSSQELSQSTVRDLMEMRLKGTYVYSLADYCEQFWHKIPPACIEDDWFAFSSGFSILHNPVNAKLKVAFDRLAAAILLLITLPLTLPIAIAIKLDSPGPVFYSQTRTGLNGKKFRVHKFRSMRSDAEKFGVKWAAERDPRITRSGRFIRMTRIDELPQLWNVLKGEMSLVGPRPERPEFDVELRQEIPYYDLRYLVKPGITGWAQVCYPYGASVEDSYQKVAYDLYYIKNYSLVLDAAIAIKTIRVVLLGKGR